MKAFVCKRCKVKLLEINIDYDNSGKPLCPICGQRIYSD